MFFVVGDKVVVKGSGFKTNVIVNSRMVYGSQGCLGFIMNFLKILLWDMFVFKVVFLKIGFWVRVD